MYIEPIQVEKLIQTKLHNFNGAKELAWAWNSGENIIFFGKGGYGKSVAAEMFGNFLLENDFISTAPYVLAFGQGMTEERLLGGLDIKKFQEEGEIIYLLKNAFVSSEFVIFEELWDAFPSVLLILKDILTSGYVRIGNESFKIKTKMIVACTNRGREEVVSDNSTEALMQRFLFEKEIGWTTHTSAEYTQALMKAVKNVNEDAAKTVGRICGKVAAGDYIPSPRTAFKAYKSYVVNGAESLIGIYGFEQIIKNEQQKIVEKLSWEKVINNHYKLKKISNQLNFSEIKSFWKVLKSYSNLYELYLDILSAKVPENYLNDFAVLKLDAKSLVRTSERELKQRLVDFKHKPACTADVIQQEILHEMISSKIYQIIKYNVK
jgi:hypothetical protein